MIPIILQPEPKDFDTLIRKPGQKWLAENSIDPLSVPLDPGKLPSYWRKISEQIWEAYGGICSYLAIYFEFTTGASTVDHFVAKSRCAGQAYEWNNYRLACLEMNRNKNKYDDVIDPVGMKDGLFWLDFLTGEITPSKEILPEEQSIVKRTILRLGLDEQNFRDMRLRHFDEYIRGHVSEDFLRRKYPFIWSEALRQKLL